MKRLAVADRGSGDRGPGCGTDEAGGAAAVASRIPAPVPQATRRARRDLLVLLLLGACVLGAGIGLRDPWPADEPRYALVAKEMVETGEWLFPHRNGELYADKPPVFFWAIAACYLLTGSLRLAFLLPSLIAGLVTLAMVHDLARRLWGRRAALAAGLGLLFTVQFTLQARTAQIDMLLAMFTTLALYGLFRHLVSGPAWGWWATAFAAMGAGVITKGVGVLPVLALIPWAWARRGRWAGVARFPFPAWKAVLGSLALPAVIAAWAVPMLAAVAASGDPQLAAYRDNILFRQTATRYVAAWHHHRWFGYYLVQVVPWAWLPLSLTLPWLVPAWARRLRRRHGPHLILLGWVALVLVFFSVSPGKRGVYVFPALPALVLAAAPLLPAIVRAAGVRRAFRWGAVVWSSVALAAAVAAPWLARVNPGRLEDLGVDPAALVPPLAAIGAAGLAGVLAWGRRRPVAVLGGTIALSWLVVGLWVNPLLNAGRYPAPFMAEVARRIGAGAGLGQLGWREQFALAADRPLVTFGYARRDLEAESREGAAWMLSGADRRLLVPSASLAPCFDRSLVDELGPRHGRTWFLAGADSVTPACLPSTVPIAPANGAAPR
ncbi:MAG: ArnT family glycosyltransferase [Acidobacteriota bacterium]